jgi:hypothetical protein
MPKAATGSCPGFSESGIYHKPFNMPTRHVGRAASATVCHAAKPRFRSSTSSAPGWCARIGGRLVRSRDTTQVCWRLRCRKAFLPGTSDCFSGSAPVFCPYHCSECESGCCSANPLVIPLPRQSGQVSSSMAVSIQRPFGIRSIPINLFLRLRSLKVQGIAFVARLKTYFSTALLLVSSHRP